MIKRYETKYCYNDVTVVPAKVSTIEHRSECNPFIKNKLPIFTAPMTSVVNEENFEIFEKENLIPILPRNIDFSKRMSYALDGKWAAFSLTEFEKYFCDELSDFSSSKEIKVLIDIANGHMKKMFDLVRKSKKIFGKRIVIMAGNIANPETYDEAVSSGLDYIRLGIGSGNGCITSSNTATHFPMASLIDEVAKIKQKHIESHLRTEEEITKIIADGGIRNYNDVIKALALGADYVMIGSLLSQTFESAAKLVIRDNEGNLHNDVKLSDLVCLEKDKFVKKNEVENDEKIIFSIKKIFYGMASAQGQIDLYGKKVKTSEGICKELPVIGTLHKWCENMTDFLRSTMSYTNSRTVNELKNSEVIIISSNTYNSVNK